MSGQRSSGDWQWRADRARGWLHSGGSVLFLGTAGPGESTAMLTSIAAQSGASRVLHCRGTSAPAATPYHALAELLATTTDEDLAPLPAPQRAVLSGAPFRAAPSAEHHTPAAIRLAALNLCRRLARTGPLLLVLDKLHYLDPASTDALRFAARSIGQRVCPRPLLVLGLGCLTPADMSHLIDTLTLTYPPDARP